jgi:hypothetical protein
MNSANNSPKSIEDHSNKDPIITTGLNSPSQENSPKSEINFENTRI